MSEYEDIDWRGGVIIREPWFEDGVEKTKYNELPGLRIFNMDGLEETGTLELCNYHELESSKMNNNLLIEAEDVPDVIDALEAWYETNVGELPDDSQSSATTTS